MNKENWYSGCLKGGRKILEGETTFRWVYMQKFGPCGAQVKKDREGIKNNGWQKM